MKERYGATIILDDEDKIFHAIAMKAGKENGGRGLLNVMEADIIDRLSKFIFERSDILRNHKILIKPFYPENPELCLFDFILK